MEFTQWGPLALASVAVLTFGWNAYRSLNRRAVAHSRASNLLGLAKTLGELDVSVMSEREIEEKKVLHERALEAGYFHTQLYVSAVAPQMTSYWMPTLILGGAAATLFLIPFQEPLTGSYSDGWSILAALVSPLLFVVASGFAYSRVERNKQVLTQLRESSRLFLKSDEQDRGDSVRRLYALMVHAKGSNSNRDREV